MTAARADVGEAPARQQQEDDLPGFVPGRSRGRHQRAAVFVTVVALPVSERSRQAITCWMSPASVSARKVAEALGAKCEARTYPYHAAFNQPRAQAASDRIATNESARHAAFQRPRTRRCLPP